jgi:menaquinone-specific isochorismate synthase
MEQLPIASFGRRDASGLLAFLQHCQMLARDRDRPQLASITLRVPHIAPLAVLQSIYAPQERHFYMERTASEEAIAGADAVVEACFSGEGRFAEVKSFAADVCANTLATGDWDVPAAGPSFFCAFTFAGDTGGASADPPARVFVPRWQVARRGEDFSAVANILVAADFPLEPIAERVWAAYRRFCAYDYADISGGMPTISHARERSVEEVEATDKAFYCQAVERALASIRNGSFEKIVLARKLRLRADLPWQPLDALSRLRERFPGCHAFSFGLGGARSFMGASPELLVNYQQGVVETEAIAGSISRGVNAMEDAQLGRQLLASAKDAREHACVRDSILRRLAAIGLSGEASLTPRLLALANVQHLVTPIRAKGRAELHLLDLAGVLHPTPAVGGSPRAAALVELQKLEGFERGLYAGLIGRFDAAGEGSLLVGIRSALIEDCEAELYAGAGIVEGSAPELEWHETEIKLCALRDALLG